MVGMEISYLNLLDRLLGYGVGDPEGVELIMARLPRKSLKKLNCISIRYYYQSWKTQVEETTRELIF